MRFRILPIVGELMTFRATFVLPNLVGEHLVPIIVGPPIVATQKMAMRYAERNAIVELEAEQNIGL